MDYIPGWKAIRPVCVRIRVRAITFTNSVAAKKPCRYS